MKALLLAAALTAAATSAQAADFTGPRAEIRAGWDQLGTGGIASPNPATRAIDDKGDGVVYGFGVGYDHALGDKLIVGVEAGFDLSDNDIAGSVGTLGYAYDPKRDIEVGARLGTKLTDNLLLYGKAGYSNARVETRVTLPGAGGAVTTLRDSGNRDGVRVGGGLELALTDRLYAKTEYRYTNYDGGFDRHQVLSGIGLRF